MREPAQAHGHAPMREVDPTLDQLLELANKLTETDRKQLLDQLALRQQKQPNRDDRDLNMWATAVYDALVASFGGGEAIGLGPLPLRKLLSATTAWGPVEGFMKQARFNELQVVERQAIYGKLAQLLVRHARTVARYADVPLSAKLVANCAPKIAGLFDAAFPGYLASDLALMVARQIINGPGNS